MLSSPATLVKGQTNLVVLGTDVIDVGSGKPCALVPWNLRQVGVQAVGSALCSSARSVRRSVGQVPNSVNAALVSCSQRCRVTKYTIASSNIELFAECCCLVGNGERRDGGRGVRVGLLGRNCGGRAGVDEKRLEIQNDVGA